MIKCSKGPSRSPFLECGDALIYVPNTREEMGSLGQANILIVIISSMNSSSTVFKESDST